MPRHLKFYGAGYVLLIASLIFTLFYYHFQCKVVADEAKTHNQTYEVQECNDQFWSGVFENDQSEMLQLAVEFFFLGGAAAYIGRSMEATSYRTEMKLDALMKKLDVADPVPEDWKE